MCCRQSSRGLTSLSTPLLLCVYWYFFFFWKREKKCPVCLYFDDRLTCPTFFFEQKKRRHFTPRLEQLYWHDPREDFLFFQRRGVCVCVCGKASGNVPHLFFFLPEQFSYLKLKKKMTWKRKIWRKRSRLGKGQNEKKKGMKSWAGADTQ